MADALTDEQRQTLQTQLADLTRKADKRRDQPGYGDNVKALDAKIAEILGQLAETPDGA